MATVKLQLVTHTSTGDDKYTNINYVNPNVSDAILKTFAEKLAALSVNSFKAVYKVTTTDITTASLEGGQS